jgi:predicted adenine nucleotide alpha hydrolase (AANH) superfamily ATPase
MPRKKLLLHICCAPCAVYLLEKLAETYDVTGFFYNPNIEPEAEYRMRLSEMKNLAAALKAPVLYGDYDNEAWRREMAPRAGDPEGGARCRLCFAYRLARTADLAARRGFDLFTTTLSISPQKNARLINEVGNEMAAGQGAVFLEADFKKKDGFRHSVSRCRERGLYRQTYCGCLFSR